MAYLSKNLSVITQSIGGRGPGLWLYWTADSIATVVAAGYISDATNKQVIIGDIVWVFSGTLNTVGPDQVPSTHAGGTVSEFASDPTFAVCVVDSISSGAATLKEVEAEQGATLGFYGAAPIAQRAGAAEATSLLSTASSTAVDTQTKAALIEIMNTLAALGLWKGSA